MHTIDAAETVRRLVEFFPAIKQPQVRSILAGVLRGVVSQRLLPQRRRRPRRRRRGDGHEQPHRGADPREPGRGDSRGDRRRPVLRHADALEGADRPRRSPARSTARPRPRPRRTGTTSCITLERAEKARAAEARRRGGTRSLLRRPRRASAAATGRTGRGRARTPDKQGRLADESGFTLTEMLVVLVILGDRARGADAAVRLGDPHAQVDQNNALPGAAGGAPRARQLRREIHCAGASRRRAAYPPILGHDHPRQLLPDGGRSAAAVTWCLKDKNGAAPPVAGARRTRSGATRARRAPAPGRSWASNLVDPPSVTAGKIFSASSVPAPTLDAGDDGRHPAVGDLRRTT